MEIRPLTVLVVLGTLAVVGAPAPASSKVIRVARHDLAQLACPGVGVCVVTDSTRRVVSFDPRDGRTLATVTLAGTPDGLTCASVGQCTVIVGYRVATTFDPRARAPQRLVDLGQEIYEDFTTSCPLTTLCVTLSSGRKRTTFDPQSPGTPQVFGMAGEAPFISTDVTCPAADVCVASTGVAATQATIFDPKSTDTPAELALTRHVGPWTAPAHLACVSTTLCAAISETGLEITFDPAARARERALRISHAPVSTGVACPTESLCVAIDQDDRAITFDPTRRNQVHYRHVRGLEHDVAFDVSCPSRDICVARGRRTIVTFDPHVTNGKMPARAAASARRRAKTPPPAVGLMAARAPGRRDGRRGLTWYARHRAAGRSEER